jgi:hypothetical protein
MFRASEQATTALGRPRTFLTIVLDESSSMDASAVTTMQAYNDFIAQQKAASRDAKDEVFVTLTKFSYARRVKTVYAMMPLAEVPRLTSAVYRPDGDTALYDGIWHAIASMEKAVGDNARVLTLVITDGSENASKEITDIGTLKQIIASREARGNWTFIFLSAGQNPYAAASGMGFKHGNVRTYAQHLGTAMVRTSNAVVSYRKGDHMQTATFWSGEAPTHERPVWTKTGDDEDVKDVV